MDGTPLHQALMEAIKNDELRSMHFTLRVTTSGVRDRSRTPPRKRAQQEDRPVPRREGDGQREPARKGKGKGKKGSEREAEAVRVYKAALDAEKLRQKDENDKVICVKFNKFQCPRGSDCRFGHSCLRCGKPGHGISTCRSPAVPK